MKSQNSRKIIVITALVLGLCLCGAITVIGGGYFVFDSLQAGPPPPLTGPDGELSEEIRGQINEIEQQVLDIRGLEPQGTFTFELLSEEELRERVMSDFFEDYTPEEAALDVRVLAAFGLMAEGFDIQTLYVDLFSEQIAGFYDNETREMVVVLGEGFLGPERITYAHEYVHALQDQAYDIQNGLEYNDESCEADNERCAAIQALLEGDATFVEIEWLSEYSTFRDKTEIQNFYSNFESPVYDSAPYFLKQDFTFPYEYGYEFVAALFEEGGWDSIEAAYLNPPISTEQILHPEKYPEDVPENIDLPDLLPNLGEGWQLLDEAVMGEWYTYLILSAGNDANARIDDETAKNAAAGWDGDAYAVYGRTDSDEIVLVMATLWESRSDAESFSNAFQTYASQRFGQPSFLLNNHTFWSHGDGETVLILEGDQTFWITAPDSNLINLIDKAVRVGGVE